MIAKLVNKHLIKTALTATTKIAVFTELISLLYKDNRINNEEHFLADVVTREKLGITSNNGIAYPHTKSAAVNKAAIAVGIKKTGIDYHDEDGITPTLFFMIAAPENCADQHIYILQELFGKFLNDEFVKSMNSAHTAEEALTVLTNPLYNDANGDLQ